MSQHIAVVTDTNFQRLGALDDRHALFLREEAELHMADCIWLYLASACSLASCEGSDYENDLFHMPNVIIDPTLAGTYIALGDGGFGSAALSFSSSWTS